MTYSSMRCKKCGLTQMSASACKSCDAPIPIRPSAFALSSDKQTSQPAPKMDIPNNTVLPPASPSQQSETLREGR